MKRTKKDLIQELESMTDHRDILVDKLEGANYTIYEQDKEITELQNKMDTLDILTDLIERLYVATIRFNGGVFTEREEIDNITQKLLDTRY